MTKNLYQDFYTASYKTSDSEYINDKWINALKAKLSMHYSSKKRVLDAACGISRLGFCFSDNVYGIDLNSEAVKVARKNGINAKLGNLENTWPYQDDYFDVVIASHIIEHLVNPDHLILEAKRVLKKNGLFIVATPNLAAWYNRLLLLFGFQPFFTEVSTVDKTLGIKFTRKLTSIREPLGHLRVFSPQALIDILELHGFDVDKVEGVEFFVFPQPLLFIDRIFTNFVNIASNIVIVAHNKKMY